ncbi:MAG: UDP-N-acetylmuramoyl-tripeptide--D-alanyl-D-alanine ligase [Muribaculaceae bacterium]|nr:UDP-N-acetylmuramoyl-tripeptide--D-alanyl-D-alanine ligase [Muribaculaceae bacterium]
MITLNTVIFIIIALIVAASLLAELSRDLMMMQQNSYRTERYMRWLRASADTTSLPRIISYCVLLASLVTFATPVWAMGIMAAFGAGNLMWLLTRSYKKPLVWTPRARRIYIVGVIISSIVAAVAVIIGMPSADTALFYLSVALTGLYCCSHIVIMAAVVLLKPVEAHINKGYYDDAARILASMPSLKVIGVTGSYGKTSTKHYLNRILSESFSVVMTPGSFNTTLGVIRTVREHLKPYTEVFICEMGAKQPGDIREICDLVHPSIGIVTAVGPQHLESFGSIENVQRTKFELIDALPASGLAVVNDDFPYVASRPVSNVECTRYAVSAGHDTPFRARDIEYTPSGTSFTVTGPDGFELRLHTRLVGECNISNLLAAVIVALHLGVPHDKIRYAVEKIEQVEHRLSIKRTPGGITIIDDAFNSNPTGSAMALDVLAAMTGGKRIVITPGMIELGAQQDELNCEFGRHVARSADVAIVVGLYNRDAITRGINDAGVEPPATYTVDTFKDAQALLQTIVAPGDTVLYENDLPDTFK